jgi:hypothetical protein
MPTFDQRVSDVEKFKIAETSENLMRTELSYMHYRREGVR